MEGKHNLSYGQEWKEIQILMYTNNVSHIIFMFYSKLLSNQGKGKQQKLRILINSNFQKINK